MHQAQAQAALLFNTGNYVSLPPLDATNAFALVCSDARVHGMPDDEVDDDDDDAEEQYTPTEEEQRFRKACLAVFQDKIHIDDLHFDDCDFRSPYHLTLIDQLYYMGMPQEYWASIENTSHAYVAENLHHL